MRACIVIAISVAALALAADTEIDRSADQGIIDALRRHVRSPDTIFVKPPGPGCVFYECIPNCKQKGYKRGGICTINGCVCLK